MSNDTITHTDPGTDVRDLDATVHGYLACWNTTNVAERAELVARWWTPDARMTDPLVDVEGHDALVAVFAAFHEQYPGCSFRRTGACDAHHDLARWGWEMVDPSGTVLLDGLDVALVTDDGRLRYVVGFFGAAIPS
jgi:hypothetical protein